MIVLSRIVWLLTGIAWAGRSLMEFAHPDYWDPVTALDWTSIWVYSAAWFGMAASVLLLARLAPTRPVVIAAALVAIAAVLAGGANALEDGFGMKSLGTFYVIGTLGAWLGLLPVAVSFRLAKVSRLAWLTAGLFGGILTFLLGGGLLILAALGSVAVVPGWYARRDLGTPAPAPAPAAESTSP